MKKRRPFNREFKIQVIREVENGIPIASVARQHEIHPSVIHKWIKQYPENPENAFSGPGKTASDPAKSAFLQRAIGERYMERDFLKKTLKH